MRVDISHLGLYIVPETDQDFAYLYDTIGIQTISDVVQGELIKAGSEQFPQCWKLRIARHQHNRSDKST